MKAPALTEGLLAQPLGLALLLGLASLLPFAFMTLTAFVKISTVLQIVRGAIGAQSVPTNTVVMAFAGALTLLAMAPVGSRIAERAGPLLEPTAERETASWVIGMVEATREPLRAFLRANASERERGRFFETTGARCRTSDNRRSGSGAPSASASRTCATGRP